jgi:hypothetical protein
MNVTATETGSADKMGGSIARYPATRTSSTLCTFALDIRFVLGTVITFGCHTLNHVCDMCDISTSQRLGTSANSWGTYSKGRRQALYLLFAEIC